MMASKEEILKPDGTLAEEPESIDLTKYPITTNVFNWNTKASLLYILLNILSFMVPAAMIITFHASGMKSNFLHWRIYMVAIDILAW